MLVHYADFSAYAAIPGCRRELASRRLGVVHPVGDVDPAQDGRSRPIDTGAQVEIVRNERSCLIRGATGARIADAVHHRPDTTTTSCRRLGGGARFCGVVRA